MGHATLEVPSGMAMDCGSNRREPDGRKEGSVESLLGELVLTWQTHQTLMSAGTFGSGMMLAVQCS